MKILKVETGEPKKGPQQVAGVLMILVFLISLYLAAKLARVLLNTEDPVELAAATGKTLGLYSLIIASIIYLYNKGFIVAELVTAEE